MNNTELCYTGFISYDIISYHIMLHVCYITLCLGNFTSQTFDVYLRNCCADVSSPQIFARLRATVATTAQKNVDTVARGISSFYHIMKRCSRGLRAGARQPPFNNNPPLQFESVLGNKQRGYDKKTYMHQTNSRF